MSAHLVALALVLGLSAVHSHPQCVLGPTTPGPETLEFCEDLNAPAADIASTYKGACCVPGTAGPNGEATVQARYNSDVKATTSAKCKDLHKQVVCSICHPYSEHLYDIFREANGIDDGLTMTAEFCEEYVQECGGNQLNNNAVYNNYCAKHTLPDGDAYYAYPFRESDDSPAAPAFPGVPISSYPAEVISVSFDPTRNDKSFWAIGRRGQIVQIRPNQPQGNPTTILDMASLMISSDNGEDGLLGFAFSPEFATNKFFYVAYTIKVGTCNPCRYGIQYQMRLGKFKLMTRAIDTKDTLEVLMTTTSDLPKENGQHFGGWIGFHPMDYGLGKRYSPLYWAIGDGGPQKDLHQDGQDNSNLWGTIVKIAVPNGSNGQGYRVPSTNPFKGRPQAGKEEIFAWGLRNPWRCSIDRARRGLALYCGVVGQQNIEWVDKIKRGRNYGWGIYEGSTCFAKNKYGVDCSAPENFPAPAQYENPWFEYCHLNYNSDDGEGVDPELCPANGNTIRGQSVIGGVRYRGTRWSHGLAGKYVFADYQTKILAFVKFKNGRRVGQVIDENLPRIISFAEDNNGEVYMVPFSQRNTALIALTCGSACPS